MPPELRKNFEQTHLKLDIITTIITKLRDTAKVET